MTTQLKRNITGDDLIFPNFDDIEVSTKTFTVNTNLNIDLEKLYNLLPITPYVVIVKKRGRKKKCDQTDPNKNLEYGAIITVKYMEFMRGVEVAPKKNKGKPKKWFRNSITVVIVFDKKINMKVCMNGTFQMTGCKTDEHAELCVKHIWKYLEPNPCTYTFSRGTQLETLFIPSMRNIDFSVGFIIDREKLNKYMVTQKDFHCLLETSFGYTGVNIKVPLQDDIRTMKIKKLIFSPNKEWILEWVTFQQYLDILKPKDAILKTNYQRYVTFLAFNSGCVICSGLTADLMRNTYNFFVATIRKAYEHIEERLDPIISVKPKVIVDIVPKLAELSLEELAIM